MAELTLSQVVTVLRVDQAERWAAGDRAPVESYLRACPELADDAELILDLVYSEFLLREDCGESPSLEEFASRFPSLADALALQVNFHHALERDDFRKDHESRSEERPGPAGGEEHRDSDGALASGWNDETPAPAGLPTVPGYRILEELGAGGMGIVYRALHLGLQRTVALKLARRGGHTGPEELSRFKVEARAAAGLHHPNIVEIYEIGELAGCPYLSFELVEGGDLSRRIVDAPMSPREAGQLIEAIALAMHYAHERGVVHRDLKPANILLTPDGMPKIADFGLAKILARRDVQTCSGTVLGSPGYMSPEQADGNVRRVGPATDVYALGAILYELLVGSPPFCAATPLETLRRATTEEPIRPSRRRPGISRDLETIVLKCLEKEEGRRYASARELAEDLNRFLNDEPVRARPATPAERVWRWSRRRPSLALAMVTAALAMVIALGVSVSFALYHYRVANELRAHVRRSEARQRQIDRLTAELAYDYGQGLCEQGDVGPGMLWLVHGLKITAQAGNRPLEHAFRLNLAGWRPRLHPLRLRLQQKRPLLAAAMSPSGEIVATAEEGGHIRFWDVATGGEVGPAIEHPAAILSLTFRPDGRALLTIGSDQTTRLWDVATGRRIGASIRHDDAIFGTAFSPDGTQIATGILREARIWDVATGRPIGGPLRHDHVVRAIAFSPDGRTLLTGSFDRTARLWDVRHGEPIGIPLAHDDYVSSVAFSPDGRTLLTGCYDGVARLWDRASGRPRGKPMIHQHCVEAVAFSPDGTRVLTGCLDGTARLWEADSGEPLGAALRHQNSVSSVAFSRDGRTILTAGNDPAVQVWEVASLEGLAIRHDGFICKVLFSADGRRVLSASMDHTARVWDAATARPIGPPLRHDDVVRALAISPDGATALTGSDDGTARLWRIPSGRPIASPLRHQGAVRQVAFSPDGTAALTGSDDGTARLWRAATAEPVGLPLRHDGAVLAVAFSPDGRFALTGSSDRTARLWDAATGRPLFTPLRHEGSVLAVAISGDGKTALTGSSDRTARLWDTATGLPLLTPLRHDGPVSLVAFSPDGVTVITGGWDRLARLWDRKTGHPAAPPLRHDGRVRALAFSPDGCSVLTGSYDRMAQLWDKTTGRPIGPPFAHQRQVWFVAYSPDGRKALSGGQQDAAHLWKIPTPSDRPVEEIELETQVATGMELAKDGTLRLLNSHAWMASRRRLGILHHEFGNGDRSQQNDPNTRR